MDKAAEQVSKWFGSAPFLIVHIVWFIAWFLLGLDPQLLTLVVSLEAIFLTILILRAEIVQSERLEDYIKETKEVSKDDLDKSDEVLDTLDEILELIQDGKT